MITTPSHARLGVAGLTIKVTAGDAMRPMLDLLVIDASAARGHWGCQVKM